MKLTDYITQRYREIVTQKLPVTPQSMSPRRPQPLKTVGTRVYGNDICPCGSRLKYKHCHGRNN